ncbi:MAG: hypothetical protein Q8K82_10455, partial [Gemmatimonadaceae bacterium]|nr:hypothetical protein [Gemmatimonadaceae bacterium]
IQLEVVMSALPPNCAAVLAPFEYVSGNTRSIRAYSRTCGIPVGAWAYVRAGHTEFSIGKNPLSGPSPSSYNAAKISALGALALCTPFTSDFGVTYSLDLSATCTSHLALLPSRSGNLGVSATSASMSVTIELVDNSTAGVVASSTSTGPGTGASVSRSVTTTSEFYNVRIKPAVAGGVGSVSVTINP